nr:ParA family protein [uncultured Niameybacter sp.]
MSKTLAIINQKGGVAKTTTALNLGVTLSLQGKNVLLIDLDSQGSLSTCCGIDVNIKSYGIVDLLKAVISDLPLPDPGDYIWCGNYLSIVAANQELAGLEASLVNVMSREYLLKYVLEEIAEGYDYVLIDCSPSMGMLTVNALAAADSVIIPLTPEYLSTCGLELLLSNVFLAKRRLNPRLEVEGILLTMTQSRIKLGRQIEEIIYKNYGADLTIFKTRIPKSVKVGEAILNQKSIIEYDPDNSVAHAYRALAKEILNNGK